MTCIFSSIFANLDRDFQSYNVSKSHFAFDYIINLRLLFFFAYVVTIVGLEDLRQTLTFAKACLSEHKFHFVP